MIEILSFGFMQNALVVSLLVSIAAGIIGSMIVVNKSVFVAGGVAHSAFGGVGLALFCGFSTSFGALIFALLCALCLSYAYLYQKERLDAYVGASWAIGMAIGIIFIDITPGYNGDIQSYLFGSILAVSEAEMVAMALFDVVLVIFFKLYYYEMLGLFFDSEFAKLRGVNIARFTSIIFVLIAIGVVVSMSVAGLILVLALLSIPAYIATLFAHSLKAIAWLSSGICLVFMIAGLALGFYLNISISAMIVVLMGLAMFGAIALKSLQRS